MKIKAGASALLLSLAFTTLTGCSMNDKDSGLPSSGISTTHDAADAAEKVSSELYDLVGVKGMATKTGAGVGHCGSDKDPEKYFTVFHPWSFVPAAPAQLEGVMERLKNEMPKHGWKIVSFGPDTSKNKNVTIVADNDAKKFSVEISHHAKDDEPKLSIFVTSGCYQIPDGEKLERF
ncbi:hypothetical protein [Streptomyces fradiae]|uniref:hypothetical protein n=1 Tax=Streptomyces fradiae TaxID=1906 RepID=UPI003511E64C